MPAEHRREWAWSSRTDRRNGALSQRIHRLNVVSCEIFAVSKRTLLIGIYLPNSTLEHLPELEEAMTRLQYQDQNMVGYLIADIGQSHNPSSQQVTNMLMDFSLVDLLHHSQHCWSFLHIKTWLQVQKDRFLSARCDYILGTDRRQLDMVGIRDVRNQSSDHFALHARILQHLGMPRLPPYPSPHQRTSDTGTGKSKS